MKKRTISTRTLALLFVLAPIAIAAASAGTSNSINFPGKATEIKSPNGLYSIVNVAKPDSKDGCKNYEIRLLQAKNKKSKTLRCFIRKIDVLWSPESDAFIVNDWAASNIAVPYLYYVSDPDHPKDISTRFMSLVRNQKDKSDLALADHSHITIMEWKNPHSVLLRAAGHGGPGGPYTLFYLWDLKDKFTRVKRVPSEVTRPL